MKDTCRSTREVRRLLLAIVAFALTAVTLGALAVGAQNPTSSQSPSATQTPAPTRAATATPTPTPTPTPVNWSTDPMLRRFVFRGVGPASMGGRIDDIACVESNPPFVT